MTGELTVEDIVTTPIGFVELTLGLPLYDWQAKAVTALYKATGPKKKLVQVAVVSPNGGGRSSRVVSGAALWWIAMHAKGRVVITTKDGKQLSEQILPAIEAHLKKFEGWHRVWSPYYKVTTPTGASLIAYTTNDENRVEGAHTDPESPLLIIIDEAKSVSEKIFEAVDKCTFDALMYSSSPGLMIGTFYNAFTKNASQFVKIQAGLTECPHIPQSKIDRIKNKYGAEHPYTLATIDGKFIAQDDVSKFAVPLDALDFCLRNPPRHQPGMKVAFCDFGGTMSEHVIAFRNGNKITIEAAWREGKPEAAANRFVREFKRLSIKQEQIYCDASDKEIWKLLSDAGWTINRQNFGAPANDKSEYLSWGAETWIEGGMAIAKGDYILDDDDELKAQLTTRKKNIGTGGKWEVQDKYELITKENLPSPDRADAVLGAIAVYDSSYHVSKDSQFIIPPGIFTNRFEEGREADAEFAESMGAGVGS